MYEMRISWLRKSFCPLHLSDTAGALETPAEANGHLAGMKELDLLPRLQPRVSGRLASQARGPRVPATSKYYPSLSPILLVCLRPLALSCVLVASFSVIISCLAR
ncbi:hypothetical protein AVEN_216854-1 [Araneus ventricosus]|uniref:Uncharacterized protein n=1 Tax=Araneus ventricosus TaxID=182803 RepID=A0A4Y2TL82_ARAVE|nr:hypothetical protein AVEN_216854-1 [Araneus ventricosus]